MKNEITIGGELMGVSVKAYGLIKKFKDLERSNRKLSKRKVKYSMDSAIHNAIAEAYSTAILLFAEEYAKSIKEV